MSQQKASAYEGFETFTNSFKMILKMHLFILLGCLVMQAFVLFLIYDKRSYENRLMRSWYKVSLLAFIPRDLKVSLPTQDGGEHIGYARDIVKYADMRRFAYEQNRRYLKGVAWSFLAYLFYPLTLYFFRRRAKQQAEKAHLRGSRLIDPKRYQKLAKRRKDPLDLPVKNGFR